MTASASPDEASILGRQAGCVERCVACRHRLLPASESLKAKLEWLHSKLAPWAEAVEPVRGVSAELRFGYREKACLRAEPSEAGEGWRLGLRVPRPVAPGLRKRKREYELIEIPDCPVHSARTRELFAALARSLPGPREIPLVFAAVAGSIVTCVLKTGGLPEALRSPERVERIWGDLRAAGATGWFANLNAAAGERVFSPRGWRLLAGEPRAFRESRWLYGPESFQQLLGGLHEKAMSEAESFLDPRAGDRVIDLCSGSGSSLKRWRDRGADALGVELGGEAVECAEANAGPGCCLRGKASERIPQLEDWLRREGGRVLLYANPPRLGLEPEVLAWIAERLRPRRLAYLSCSAGTLARDLAVLAGSGYRVRKIHAYDFFPGTDHVEALALVALA